MDSLAQFKQNIVEEFVKFEELYCSAFQTSSSILKQVYAHVNQAKGKQIRPILSLLSAKLCGNVNEVSYYAALMLELLHNTSLIHDDVVDEAAERRGFLSVNRAFGNKVAVLSGDYLLAQVFSYTNKIQNEEILQSFSILGKSLAEGELIQLRNANNPVFDSKKYIEVIRKKTAILFSTCMYVGAKSVDASNEEAERLYNFGECLGICFQVKDDIFDYLDDHKTIGKPTGNDIREKKITLPLILAYQKATTEDKIHADELLKKESLAVQDIDFFIQFVRKYDGISASEEYMKNFRNQAVEGLRKFPQNPIIDDFISILDFVISREK